MWPGQLVPSGHWHLTLTQIALPVSLMCETTIGTWIPTVRQPSARSEPAPTLTA
jgi:hypothetical protein